MTTESPVILQIDGHRARITLNRAEQHNSLDANALAAFHELLDEVQGTEQLRVLEITGAGTETFCAGASLKQLDSGEMDPALFTTLTDRLDTLPLPSICALNGSVYGGGVEVALCCDFRIGVRGSRLRVPAAQIGLCYPLNGTRRFLSRLGLQTARRLLLACEELDADDMLQLGFLDRLVAQADLETAVAGLSERLQQLAPLALRAMKSSLNQLAGDTVNETFLGDLATDCALSEDLGEGLAAQRERRPARFSGR